MARESIRLHESRSSLETPWEFDPDRVEHVRTYLNDVRSADRIHAHLALELGLAARLRHSQRTERIEGRLYTSVYDALFRGLPDHPQLNRSKRRIREDVDRQVAILKGMSRKHMHILEIGAGDCAVSLAVKEQHNTVTALDVTDRLVDWNALATKHVDFVLSDGVSVPLDAGTIDLAYSNQLLEHLHPDDAVEQTRNVRSALREGGQYYLVTPHRRTGPHDISIYAGEVAQGLHLLEYDYRMLARLAHLAGFRSVSILLCRGHVVIARIPISLAICAETALTSLFRLTGKSARQSRTARFMFGIHAILYA